MRATIASTTVLTEIDGVPVRLWHGKTAGGVPFACFVHRCVVGNGEDSREFAEALREEPQPRTLAQALSLRNIL